MNQPADTIETNHALHPSIVREYDIRGIVGETLFTHDAYYIGLVYANMAAEQAGKAPTVVLGRDGRLSSPDLANAMVEGLRDGGADVIQIGVGPTPMLYFSVYHLHADAGVMVTGSHNPPTHNGFKLMMGKASFFGEQICELARRIAASEWQEHESTIREEAVYDAYLDTLMTASDIYPKKPFQIVWDAGNGAAGEVSNTLAGRLAKQGCANMVLHYQIDGTFPNHHPDPSVPENMKELQDRVIDQEAQLGVAFDGDGDRLGAVDDKGRIVSPDHLLMLLAQHVLADKPGATVIADVKSSQTVFDAVKDAGGEPLMWKTGHSHIKSKMKEVDAAFAGEASGHIFFADRYFGFDDGLYAALRLIELCVKSDRKLSDLIDALPSMKSTPEIRIDVAEERKFVVIDEIRDRLNADGTDYLAIDGVRVMTAQGWWLIRASNTQAAIIARAESDTDEGLQAMTDMLKYQLSQSSIEAKGL